MKRLTQSGLYIQVILLLIILHEAFGIEETPYFLQRKKMLEEMNVTIHPRPKDSKVDKSYYSHHPIRHHNYDITINEPDLCREHNQVFLLILYRTMYAHVKWREVIRELLYHDSSMPYRKGLIVKHLFIFGNSGNPHVESLIRNESKHHRDIIQEDFIESYFNLTIKVITAWKWAVNFCPNTEYVMILNDELLLDLDKIIIFLLQDYSMGKYDDHFALCFARINKRPLFLSQARYRAMPRKSVYKGKFFPSYCHGWGYAAHIKIINKLYRASFTNPSFMPTDVWIGVLSEKLRLTIYDHMERFVLYNVAKYFSDPLYPTRIGMIAVTDHETKGHELKVIYSVRNSLRHHWKIIETYRNKIYDDRHVFSHNLFDYSELYVSISIFTFVVIAVLFKIFRLRILKL